MKSRTEILKKKKKRSKKQSRNSTSTYSLIKKVMVEAIILKKKHPQIKGMSYRHRSGQYCGRKLMSNHGHPLPTRRLMEEDARVRRREGKMWSDTSKFLRKVTASLEFSTQTSVKHEERTKSHSLNMRRILEAAILKMASALYIFTT